MILGYRKKQSIAFVGSAALHAALVAFLMLYPREEKPEPVVVEFLETVDSDVLSSSQKTDARSNEHASVTKRADQQANSSTNKSKDDVHAAAELKRENANDVKQFALSTRERLRDSWSKGDVEVSENQATARAEEKNDTDATGSLTGDPMAALETEGGGFSSAVQYSNRMDLEFTNESVGFFQSLHRRVDGPLIYPDDFSRQRLTGKVRIEAELRSDGTLVKFLSTVSDNDILQVYSLAYLSHVLSQPLPLRSHLKYERVVVSFDFDFRVRVAGTNPVTLETGYRKNHLLFARESLVDPWLNEKVNEIFTHYVPPIIPLPGGFYVDFIAAFKYFKNLKEGNPTESEARTRRIETLHEKLKQSVRSKKPS